MSATESGLSERARQQLLQVSVATLTTCLYREGITRACPVGIAPVSPEQARMVGPAYTLRFVPMREDVGGMSTYGGPRNVHQRAFEDCPPGHVLVMDTRGETRGCSCGDLLIGRLKARGCAGVVTDGGFRDVGDIRALGLPAYQRCTVPPPSFGFLQAVDVNVPVGCGDVAVYPGDIVVGDADGVVFIPAHLVERIAELAHQQTLYETFAAEEVARGRSIIGLYPATDASRRDFDAWCEKRPHAHTDTHTTA
ncbi:ribonuclease activity regulator RraA [Hydrogenophaga sp.]|uniref:ribonuclease activity regulator RraA n=1 Tax=Hydrogenophaga sp. TaxID=1904254 RepID=UPI00271E4DDA|nr:ribonuclease activity regulator RraA [Hydrogenophaga sp.]MDO9434196.1 ribonuclease activity regulator RraA [Hydrogenophaga sp.]